MSAVIPVVKTDTAAAVDNTNTDNPQHNTNAFKSTSPVDLTFKDINYGVVVKNSRKEILKNLSGVFKSGTATAILGASGGGKTSLLNVLSGKIQNSGNVKLSGEIKANGKTFSNDKFNRFSAYVMQNDILLESLTARECIQFAADFKLSGTTEFKAAMVDQVIHVLNLKKCQHTLIGGQFLKGVSGGERKRVNIGCELITNPSVLFLDEPTSGLDSFTAFIVVNTLKKFAKVFNKTVIMSIHSPNTDIWNLFDRTILLVQGRIIYQGDQHLSIDYFKNIGFECPTHMCAADYFMKQMTWSEEHETQTFPILFENYEKQLASKISSEIESVSTSEIPIYHMTTSFLFQAGKITYRTFLSMQRNPLLFKSRIYQTLLIAIFFGLVYLNQNKITPSSTMVDLQNKIGVLFLCVMSTFMQSLNAVILSFPAERLVFLKEENSKYYSTIAYITGRLSLEFIIISVLPVFTSVIVYFMVDLNQDSASHFFYFLAFLILLSWTGNALGLVCGILITDPRTAAALQPIFKLPFILFSGFAQNRNDFQAWNGWITKISPFMYALEGVVTNEFEGVESPIDVKAYYGFNIGKKNCLYILIGLFAGFQVLSILSLYKMRGTLQ